MCSILGELRDLRMDNTASQSSSLESELYFLIARFLSAGPCKRTTQVLLEELEEFKLLEKRVDWEGNQHFRTYENLVYLNRHIRSDHLLKVVERIGPLLDKDIKSSVPGVRSLLGAGSLSLLRTSEDLERPKWGLNHHLVLQNGAPQYPPMNLVPPNLVQVMPAYQLTGVVRPRSAVPTVLYNKMSMYGRKLGHLDAVYCVLFDRTGKYIFTGADDTLVKIWSRHDLRLLATLRGHSAEITDIALSYENTFLASASLDKSVRVWCLRTKAQCAVLHAHSSMITSVQFCPKICGDTRYLVSTGNDGCVCFWAYNIVTNYFNPKPIKFIEKSRAGAQMLCSSFSPGGAFLATGNSDHVVRVYFLHRIGPEKICELEAHNDKVDSICYANRHNSFISGSNDGTARIWRFDKQEWRATVLNMASNLNGSLRDTGDERIRVTMVSWTNDDNRVITAASDLTMKIWNPHTGSLVRVLEGHEDEVFVLETSPTDTRILVSAAHDGKIFIWDIETGAKIKKFFNLIEGQGHGAVFDCKFSPDGQYLAATDSHGHLLLMGIGSSERCKKTPQQLFFHSDYRPLIRDSKGFVLDEQTQCPPHLMPPPFLVDIDGNPYPPAVQRLVPGREHAKASSLVPHIAVNEAGESEVVGDHQPEEPQGNDRGEISDTDVDIEEVLPQQPAAVGAGGAVRASIDVMIQELQRQQDRRLAVETVGSGQVMSPPPPSLASPPPTPRANAHSRVGMRRSGEIEGVRQSRASISVDNPPPPPSKQTEPGKEAVTVYPLTGIELEMSEEQRIAYTEEEISRFVAERKKKLISPVELVSASIANNKRRQKAKKPAATTQYLDDIPENVETARNRLTTRALYDTEEEAEAEGGGSDWQSDSSGDYSDWVGDQGNSNLEPPKRRSQRTRKRRYISSSEEEEEEEDSDDQNNEEESGELTVNLDEVEENEAATTTDAESSQDEDEDKDDQEQEREQGGTSRMKRRKRRPGRKPNPKTPQTPKKNDSKERSKEMDEKMKPPDWITTVIPRKAPFVPQMGDEVVYFRQGHEQYLHAVKRKEVYKVDLEKNQPWHKIPNLRAHEEVKIIGIKWLIQPTRLCCLKLAFMETETGKLTGKSFTIKYHDMPDVIDFIVLKQHYDISVQRGWKQGSRFRSMIDDQWWLGVIKSKEPMSPEFPDSLFQCFNVHWDNGEYEKLSPWDMEPIDNKRKPSVVGGGVDVTQDEYKALLYQPKKTEWPSCGREAESERLVDGISSVMQHSFAEAFSTPVDLQRFPTYAYFVSYPIDLSTIKTRLENGFYRRVTALQWDVRLIHTNAIVFNQSGSKIVQMANYVTETLLEFIKDQECRDPLSLLTQLAHDKQKSRSSDDDAPAMTKKNTGGRRERKSSKKAVNPNRWLEESESLLAMLFECEDSSPFRLPVDPVAYPDYNTIVRNAMDLTTVHTKLATGHYSNPLEMCKDIRLMFSNSKLYNTNKRSRIYSMTLRLSALFEDQISPVIKQWKLSTRANSRLRQQTSRGHASSSSQQSSTWSSLITESLLVNQPSTSGLPGPSSSRDTASRLHQFQGSTSSSSTGRTANPSSHSFKNSKPKAATIRDEEEDSDATIVDDDGGVKDGDDDDSDNTEICDDGEMGSAITNGRGAVDDTDEYSNDDERNDSVYYPSSKGKTFARGKGKSGKGGKDKSSNPLRPSLSRVKKSSIFYVSDGDDNFLDEEDSIIIPPVLKFGRSKNGMVHSFEVPRDSDEEDLNDLDIKDTVRTSRKSNRKTRGKRKPRFSLSPEVKKPVQRKARSVRRNVKVQVFSDEESEITPEKINDKSALSSRSSRTKRKHYNENSDLDQFEDVVDNRVKAKHKSVEKDVNSDDDVDSGDEESENDETEEDSGDETNSSLVNGYHSSKRGGGVSKSKPMRKVIKRKLSSEEDEEKMEEDSEEDFQEHKKFRRISKPAMKSAKMNNHSARKTKPVRTNNSKSSKSVSSSNRDAKLRTTRNRGQQRVTYSEDWDNEEEDDDNDDGDDDEDDDRSDTDSSKTEIDDEEEEESSVRPARSVSSRGRLRKMTTRAKESLKAF